MENTELENTIIEKLKILKGIGYSFEHNPNTTGISGMSGHGSFHIVLGRMNLRSLNLLLDNYIKEHNERKNYDRSVVDNLLKVAGYTVKSSATDGSRYRWRM